MARSASCSASNRLWQPETVSHARRKQGGTIHPSDYSFDGRVAIVTGAGRGLGRAYARLLAQRGASIVVNDLGTSMTGAGTDLTPAEEVAAEIVAAGGSAVADSNDISSPSSSQALVDAAIETYGRIDILINNAGIIEWSEFPAVDDENFGRHLAVHLGGSFLTTRAAWPHLVKQEYGRVVMTTSSGVFGLPNNTAYAAAKGGVIGLTRSLATAGMPHGIRVNAIAPAAGTRMAGRAADESGPMSSDLVAPMVAYLAHETCPVTGEIYAAGAGRFARIVLAQTPGYVHPGERATIEDIATQWDAINDERGFEVPNGLMAWSKMFLAHLPAGGADG
ncbi:MAG TPA: SDR family NAD(P)-dependent oxidoreductase [Mycobacteriales bacterium]|nr:SDR family NAD(P)-dependent oxidoreductase [Mycobacteriales bacterium]